MLMSRWGQPGRESQVLDLFAGSGGLGLECLSRGAASAVLVDHDPRAYACLRANLGALGDLGARSCSLHMAALPALSRLADAGKSFDLVLLDPPYAGPPVAPVMAALVRLGLLAPGAVVICEHPGHAPPPAAAPPLALVTCRRWGAVAISFFQHLPPSEPFPCASPSTPDPLTPSPLDTSTSSSEASPSSTV